MNVNELFLVLRRLRRRLSQLWRGVTERPMVRAGGVIIVLSLFFTWILYLLERGDNQAGPYSTFFGTVKQVVILLFSGFDINEQPDTNSGFLLAMILGECQRVPHVLPDPQWRWGRIIFHGLLLILLLAATWIDLRHYEIPDEITVTVQWTNAPPVANAGQDTVNAIKQANQFQIVQGGQKLAGMLVFITDVHSMGLEIAQGLQFTTAFYWDRNDESREWSQRFFDKHGAMPTMVQAGVYSATMHYLEAIKAAGTDDADAVRAQLGQMELNDFFVKNGKIEANGLMSHDMYLAKVKTPDQSKSDWDLLDIVSTIPAEKAYIPVAESSCSLVKQ